MNWRNVFLGLGGAWVVHVYVRDGAQGALLMATSMAVSAFMLDVISEMFANSPPQPARTRHGIVVSSDDDTNEYTLNGHVVDGIDWRRGVTVQHSFGADDMFIVNGRSKVLRGDRWVDADDVDLLQ